MEALAAPDERLLTVLRDRLGVTDITDGCSPQGQCGCCTVWVDGLPRVACATPARRVAGREVTTPAALPGDLAASLGGAFAACGASQCGFCSPGIVMRLAWLLRRTTEPGEVDIDRALAAHICRCTGWEQIRQATRRAGDALAGRMAADPLPDEPLALGARAYVDDRRPAGGRAASPILAPGPGRLRQPLAAPPGFDLVALAEEADHDGVVLGLLVGPDRPAVRAALETFPLNWEAAPGPPPPPELFLSPAHPAFLEPESVVVDGDRVIIACERPAGVDWAEVESVPDGGSFGGKRFPWLEDLALQAAPQLQSAFTITLTREESIRCGPSRHGAWGHVELEGDLLTGEVTFIAGGRSLCPSDVVEMARWCLPGPYRLRSEVEVGLETTWGPPSGWMRGEGSLAPVALREAAIGPGLDRRLELLEPGSSAHRVLRELAAWLQGEEPAGVAAHVGRLPEMAGAWARWEGDVLVHPFCSSPDLAVPQRGTGELGPCPRGGGWPLVLVSWADGCEPGGAGPAVAAAALSEPGAPGTVAQLRVVVDAGRLLDPVMAEGHARGGAHMGVGAALSEQVVRDGGVTSSITIRSLGVIPAAATPPIEVRFIRTSGPARAGIAEAAVAPVAAAVMMAAGARHMPALDTVAGRRVRRQR